MEHLFIAQAIYIYIDIYFGQFTFLQMIFYGEYGIQFSLVSLFKRRLAVCKEARRWNESINCLLHHSDAAPSALYPLNQLCCFVLFKLRKDVSDLCFSCMPLASQNHMLLGLLSHYQITSFSHPYCAAFLVQKYFMCIKVRLFNSSSSIRKI